MRALRSGLLAVLLLAAAGAATATASPRPPLFENGRYAALGEGGSLSFVVARSQIIRLQVRMPFVCQNKRTHARTVPTLAFSASTGHPSNTYSRIYLPADGNANVSFVVEDNSRQPAVYLSLQLHGGVGHVSLHARSDAGREACSGELGFDVQARSNR
jgi:hypothetical protein